MIYSTGEPCWECGGTGYRHPTHDRQHPCAHCGGWGYRVRSEPTAAERQALTQHADTVAAVEALVPGPLLWRPASEGLLRGRPYGLEREADAVRVARLGAWCRLQEQRPAGVVVYYREP